MAKNVEFHDQGQGVLDSHLVVAREYLKQNGKEPTFENMVKAVNKLARDKEESYTPSDDMGKNPASSVSAQIRKVGAPWLYADDKQFNVLNKLGLNREQKQIVRKDIHRAINNISHIIMKNFHGFKVNDRGRSKDFASHVTDNLTDFEYVGSGPNGLSKAQRDRWNTTVEVNRMIRAFIETYIATMLLIVINDNQKTLYDTFKKIYEDADNSVIRSKKVQKKLVATWSHLLFKQIGFDQMSKLFQGIRVDSKGNVRVLKKK